MAAKSAANLQSPSVVLKQGQSMSEKMSFYLNLSESQDNTSQMRESQAIAAHVAAGIQHQVSDAEKARQASTSLSGSNMNGARVPIVDEAEYLEMKK